MKKFTVWDFINYNAPCFSCNNKIEFRLRFCRKDNAANSYFKPVVKSDHSEVDLKITYSDAVKLSIYHKTNKIATNDLSGLVKYVDENKLYLASVCDFCGTNIRSDYLEFDFNKNLIVAVELHIEILSLSDGQNHYIIKNNFNDDKSRVVISIINRGDPPPPIVLNSPLLPRYKFKDKKQLIEKLKLYLTFS